MPYKRDMTTQCPPLSQQLTDLFLNCRNYFYVRLRFIVVFTVWPLRWVSKIIILRYFAEHTTILGATPPSRFYLYFVLNVKTRNVKCFKYNIMLNKTCK